MHLRVIVSYLKSPDKQVDLLRNTIELPEGLGYDYQALISGIKLLYPNYKNLIINLIIL